MGAPVVGKVEMEADIDQNLEAIARRWAQVNELTLWFSIAPVTTTRSPLCGGRGRGSSSSRT